MEMPTLQHKIMYLQGSLSFLGLSKVHPWFNRRPK